jgi:hypothetical protein
MTELDLFPHARWCKCEECKKKKQTLKENGEWDTHAKE